MACTVVDGSQAVNVAGFLQAFAQGLVNLAVGAVELHQVVGIIKHIPGVHNGHRLVLGCELSRSVHIQVQVAALDGGVHFRSRTKGAVGVNFNGNRAAAVLIDQLGEALSSNVDLVVSGLGVAKAQGNGLVAGCSGAFSGARSTRSSRRCCGAAAGGQHTGGHNGAQDFQCFFHGVCASLFLRFLFLFIWETELRSARAEERPQRRFAFDKSIIGQKLRRFNGQNLSLLSNSAILRPISSAGIALFVYLLANHTKKPLLGWVIR